MSVATPRSFPSGGSRRRCRGARYSCCSPICKVGTTICLHSVSQTIPSAELQEFKRPTAYTTPTSKHAQPKWTPLIVPFSRRRTGNLRPSCAQLSSTFAWRALIIPDGIGLFDLICNTTLSTQKSIFQTLEILSQLGINLHTQSSATFFAMAFDRKGYCKNEKNDR